MPKIKPPPKTWCKRCQERELTPDPRAPLAEPRHEKFARNIAILNMTNAEAYRKSGYAAKNNSAISGSALKLRKRLEVANRIKTLSERAIASDLRTRELIDDKLMEVANRCMQAVPVMDKGGRKPPSCKTCGRHLGEWKFDSNGANKALHLMGKDRGMFADKVQITTDELGKKTPEEILELLKATGIELGRDTVRIMGEAVGIYETGAEASDGAKTPTVEPVSTLQ